ncbi:hypothetical protein DEM27_31800 [Metarhizobium album]|uniref:Uncharacterized protein n=2 Tax=Metarhizobium album TaxID=2182425 RepID=A0A2U2DG71_9HYPH|nr:hypothetical protein DEM27_31800 [Rhizobium album]
MRPKLIPDGMLMRIRARKSEGASFQTLAHEFGFGKTTILEAINGRKPPRPVADNDNYPDRITVMSPRNGGCSTTSGLMPVTLKRIPTIDGHARVAA